MPTYRKLHTKIVDSYDFNEMPDDFTRLFWVLLTVTVDSEGRGMNNQSWLKSKMFPMREDVTSRQIADAMGWLINRRMVIPYEIGGRSYFYLPTFKKYQSGTEKEAKSVLPVPPDLLQTYSGVSQEKVSAAASASVSVSVSASDNEPVSDIDYVAQHEQAEQNELAPFDIFQRIVERAGINLSGAADIKALQSIVAMGANEDDLRAGIAWKSEHSTGPLRWVSSVVEPTRTSMQMRLKANGANKVNGTVYTDAHGNQRIM